VSSWKIIVATLVIFGAGFATGLFVEKASPAKKVPEASLPIGPAIVQQRFLERMKKELALTDEQFRNLEVVFRESRERWAALYDFIGPDLDAEVRHVREAIRSVLDAKQKEKFAQLLREPRHQSGFKEKGGPRGSPGSGKGPRKGPPGANSVTSAPPASVSSATSAPAAR
jgi:hypothetical protein